MVATIHIHHRHLLLLLSPKADTHFTIPWRVEGPSPAFEFETIKMLVPNFVNCSILQNISPHVIVVTCTEIVSRTPPPKTTGLCPGPVWRAYDAPRPLDGWKGDNPPHFLPNWCLQHPGSRRFVPPNYWAVVGVLTGKMTVKMKLNRYIG